MGRYLIKPEKDADFYVEWSTNVDDAISWGAREDMLGGDITEDRLARCDEVGTSAKWFRRSWIGEHGRDWEVWRQEGRLTYSRMKEFFSLAEKHYAEGDVCNIPDRDIHPDLMALIEPFEK